MRAMVLDRQGKPLQLKDVPVPELKPGHLLLRVTACGICRTDLHVVDGDLTEPALPLVPGHQVIGVVEQVGEGVDPGMIGRRLGAPWLGGSCGQCRYCHEQRENLCDLAVYNGYQVNGGFAEYMLADARFCFPIPPAYADSQAAPLLCAGLIGHRAYRLTGDAAYIGIYGFGAAAHIITQVARNAGKHIFAFTRAGDTSGQEFALSLGAEWAGDAGDIPPAELDAAIIFAPAGELVPIALRDVRRGGIVVCAGIHMSDIPSFPYALLWGERQLCSVANLTRRDGEEFLPLAASIPVRTEVTTYPLEAANQALDDLRQGRFNGAAVLLP